MVRVHQVWFYPPADAIFRSVPFYQIDDEPFLFSDLLAKDPSTRAKPGLTRSPLAVPHDAAQGPPRRSDAAGEGGYQLRYDHRSSTPLSSTEC